MCRWSSLRFWEMVKCKILIQHIWLLWTLSQISMMNPEGLQEERSSGGDKKSNLSPWCHLNQLLSSFISWTTIWAYLVCLILVSGTVSSHKAVNSGQGEALLSIPHEIQWTIQSLPTALSVQQQYQRWCWLTMHIRGIHSIRYWLFVVVVWNLYLETFLMIANHTKVGGWWKIFTFLEEPHTSRRNHKTCLKWSRYKYWTKCWKVSTLAM